MSNNVYILPFLRKGMANYIDSGKISETNRAQFDVDLILDLTGADGNSNTRETLNKSFVLAGPQDVKGISEAAICQVVPANESKGSSYSFMPYVEFYEEDLPWRFSPVAPNGKRLTPWVMLIACTPEEYEVSKDKQGNHFVRFKGDAPDLFPRYHQFSKLAHVQVASEVTLNSIPDIINHLESDLDAGVSRIICHRKLKENQQYVVFMVPAFESGRRAAVGNNSKTDRVDQLTWNDGQKPDENTLFPIYHQWTFKSGGDTFETLAKKLYPTCMEKYNQLQDALKVDVSKTGLQEYKRYSTKQVDDKTPIDIQVALVKNSKTSGGNLRSEPQEMVDELKGLLKKSPMFDTPASNEIDDPWVVPPVYGARHVLATKENLDNTTQNKFISELNLKFKHRIAAGMGSRVVRDNQEELVNRAWLQVTQINAINQKIREYALMKKSNDASDKKLSERRYYTYSTELNGLQTDAAIRIANAQKSGNINGDTIAEKLSDKKGYDELVKAVGKPYFLAQGISKKELEILTNNDFWDSHWREIACGHNNIKVRNTFRYFEYVQKYKFLRWRLRILATDLLFDDDKQIISEKKDEKIPNGIIFKKSVSLSFPPIISYFLRIRDGHFLMNWLTGQTDKRQKKTGVYYKINRWRDLLEKQLRLYTIPFEKKIKTSGEWPDRCYEIHGYYWRDDDTKEINNKISADFCLRKPDFFILSDESYAASFGDYPNGVEIECLYANDRSAISLLPLSRVLSNDPTYAISIYDDEYKSERNLIQLYRDENNHFTPLLRKPLEWYHAGYVLKHTIPSLYSIKKYQSLERTHIFLNSHCTSETFSGYGIEQNKNNWVRFEILEDGNTFKLKSKQDGKTEEFYFDTEVLCARRIQAADKKKAVVFNMNIMIKEMGKLIELLQKFEYEKFQPNTIFIDPLNDLPKVSAYSWAGNPNLETVNELIQTFKTRIGVLHNQVNHEILNKKPDNTPLGNYDDSGKKKLIDASEENSKKLQEIVNTYMGTAHTVDLERFLNSKYPIMAYPVFPDPTSFYLRELSERYLLPSVDSLTNNSITVFKTNSAFEEAFLAGMNTEMGRELLWREYPTDERGSYFRKFWDQITIPEKFDDKYFDVKRMHEWTRRLGENHEEGKSAMIVFAIKGELMQAYPNTEIYLSNYTNEKYRAYDYPIMGCWLTDDTYIVGFKPLKNSDQGTFYLTFEEADSSRRFLLKPDTEDDSSMLAYNRYYHGAIYGVEIEKALLTL